MGSMKMGLSMGTPVIVVIVQWREELEWRPKTWMITKRKTKRKGSKAPAGRKGRLR